MLKVQIQKSKQIETSSGSKSITINLPNQPQSKVISDSLRLPARSTNNNNPEQDQKGSTSNPQRFIQLQLSESESSSQEYEGKVKQEHRSQLSKTRRIIKIRRSRRPKNQKKQYKITRIGHKFRVDFETGEFYIGQMKNSTYNSNRQYFSVNQGNFQGQWKDGKCNGYGVCIAKQGTKSTGFYIDDQRTGKGTDQYLNGQRYEGDFIRDVRQGHGKLYNKNGGYFQGQWKDNQPHGKGCETYIDGSYYEGTWNMDEKDGVGMLYQEGCVTRQVWKNRKLISSMVVK